MIEKLNNDFIRDVNCGKILTKRFEKETNSVPKPFDYIVKIYLLSEQLYYEKI